LIKRALLAIGLLLFFGAIGFGYSRLSPDAWIDVVYYSGWAAGIGVFGLGQVWVGAVTSYSRAPRPRLFRASIWENLLDGNLFIFSISAAGTVLASSVGLVLSGYRTHAAGAATTNPTKAVLAVWLLLLIVVLVFAATFMWTNFKSKYDARQQSQRDTAGPDPFEITASVYCASIAVLAAFFAELLR